MSTVYDDEWTISLYYTTVLCARTCPKSSRCGFLSCDHVELDYTSFRGFLTTSLLVRFSPWQNIEYVTKHKHKLNLKSGKAKKINVSQPFLFRTPLERYPRPFKRCKKVHIPPRDMLIIYNYCRRRKRIICVRPLGGLLPVKNHWIIFIRALS